MTTVGQRLIAAAREARAMAPGVRVMRNASVVVEDCRCTRQQGADVVCSRCGDKLNAGGRGPCACYPEGFPPSEGE